jgi:glycosyltransferase involved in cell wall biosynthesis
MRVLLLGPYPPPHGGVQSNLVAIRTFLRRKNIPCAVINITRHRKRDADEVYYPNTAAEVLQLLWRLKYDVIHLHLGGTLNRRVLALGLACTVQPGSKSVLTFHSGGYPSSPEGQATGRGSFAGFVLRRFDGVIGVNREIMDFFHRLGVPGRRSRLILPHSFLPEEQSDSTLSPALDSFFSTHHPLLLSVAGLEPEYDLPMQIEVLGRVRDKFGSAGLVLIGSGSLEAEIRAQIKSRSDAEHILLCGDLPHSETMKAISRADLMLRTTLYDGDAISVREALHLGTPVIATDNGMRPKGVHLVPTSNLEALSEAIEQRLLNAVRNTKCSPPDDTNLRAVFQFYKELMGDLKAGELLSGQENSL